MPSPYTIVGLGEALFDLLPDRQVLGGAPLNVAFHAHQLGRRFNGRGVVVSRVGQDALGQEIYAELRRREMSTVYLQSDPDYPTGKVYVSFDAAGQPSYEILGEVAWDMLQFDPDTESLAGSCEAVSFGSLAQRDSRSRNTIYRFLERARRAVRLFDVNLRQDFYDRRILDRSCEYATAVKLNDGELPVVARLLGIGSVGATDAAMAEAATSLLRKYQLQSVILTRGARGTMMVNAQGVFEGKPARYDSAENADAVGAGDACTAAVLTGMVLRWPAQRTVDAANVLGAYVASQPGATPSFPDHVLQAVSS